MQIYDYLQKKATLSPITPFKMGRMEVSQTPTSILESGLLPLSIGLCMQVSEVYTAWYAKKARQQVFCTGSSAKFLQMCPAYIHPQSMEVPYCNYL